MSTFNNRQKSRLGLIIALLLISLSGCFKDASDDNANPTQRKVDLSDLQGSQSRATASVPAPTATVRADLPSFTPAPSTPTATEVIGGPPGNTNTTTPEASLSSSTPRVTATITETTSGLATVEPPDMSDIEASDTPTASPDTTGEADDTDILSTPTEIPDANDCIYLVEGGDTLFSLAEEYDLLPEDFYPINPELRANPDNLYIGQEILIPNCIPEGATIEPTAEDEMEAEGTPATDAPDGVQTYVVQDGDNLFRIALNFGISLDALVAANPTIPSENTIIYPGDVLIIPTE